MAGAPIEDILERLKDPEYARLYGEESAKVDFAITLTKARKSLNLTQKDLAEKLGISQPYVAKLEGGEANPTLSTIGRLLAAINLRLVTGTAPLAPEASSSFRGFVFMSAADQTKPEAYVTTYRGANTATIECSPISPWQLISETEKVPVGGAAR